MTEGRKTKTVFYVMCPECSKALKIEAEFNASPDVQTLVGKPAEKKKEVPKNDDTRIGDTGKPGSSDAGDKHSKKGKEVQKV